MALGGAVMPTISVFFGITIQMYWRDHAPPHLHAFYQEHEGVFDLNTQELIIGEMPRPVVRLIRQWIIDHQPELLANWERGRTYQPFNTVSGADSE
jgi:hypothetical protein